MKIKGIKGVRKITKKSILRYDSKGEINLWEIAKGVNSYRVRKEESGQIILTPFVEIPFLENWIFENQDILEKIKSQFNQDSAE
ncbi:hypothetical protein [Candidatus Paracaedibacter symbiosus]|uniref:hypothetical protein n=1 Tax=Candidatus Paracaedibacter symbiosus TaxID=244582 RepID=UPI00068E6548|nr:hypothetical protein [Candidatus Paracaedibacter symbiosus]